MFMSPWIAKLQGLRKQFSHRPAFEPSGSHQNQPKKKIIHLTTEVQGDFMNELFHVPSASSSQVHQPLGIAISKSDSPLYSGAKHSGSPFA